MALAACATAAHRHPETANHPTMKNQPGTKPARRSAPTLLLFFCLVSILPALSAGNIARAETTPTNEPVWLSDKPVPKTAELSGLNGVQFHVIKANEPEKDGYKWLHGVALAWHKGKLYASFGHNKGAENTGGEEARGCVSEDGGRTWGKTFTIASPDEPDLGISHGVFLSRGGELWAFQAAFYGNKLTDIASSRVHTRAYVLNETTNAWEKKGTVIEGGFWPMQEPLKMDDGNWIISGLSVGDGHPGAVAISHGDDLTKWDLVRIPRPATVGMWGESTIILNGKRVQNFARINSKPPLSALTAVSEDYGRTWTDYAPSNLPMVSSKPTAGRLSNGQPYLVCTTTAEAETSSRRSPLTIAVGKPGDNGFRRIFRIRGSVCPESPGDSSPRGGLSYPYAIEHDDSLYVGFSNSGGRGGNDNSAELAIIPLASLAVDAPEPPIPEPTSASAQSWPLESVDSAVIVYGAATVTPGVKGQSLALDGGSVIELADSARQNSGPEGFTFSVWFKSQDPLKPLDPILPQQAIAAKARYSLGERQWSLTVEKNGRLMARVYQDTWKSIKTTGDLEAGRWYQASLAVETDKATLYLDGQPVGKVALTKPIPVTDAPITLGGVSVNGKTGQQLVGAVDEARFEPHTLTAEEIAASYQPADATPKAQKPSSTKP